MKDIWLVRPALYGMPEVKLFGFARMFFKNVNKKDFLHAHMYGRLEKMIALSHIQKEFLKACLPVDDAHFTVIPNGVDTERFRPRPRREDIRESWGIKQEHILFGLIGRLDRQKGSLEFVEAAAEVIERSPLARFVLVGGNTLGEGDFDRLVRRRLQELNLEGKVLLTDFRKDIPDVMNALDVFVMPSYEENFANVLLEALASGLPSISTNSGGTPEILDGGNAGLLCDPQSASALAAAMLKVLNPEIAADLSRHARARAEAEYDMRKVFQRVESLVPAT
jgi:glycosyltransferase involved in cell wall biosynthesis